MVGIRTAIHQGGIWDTGKKQPAGLRGSGPREGSLGPLRTKLSPRWLGAYW